MHNGSSICWRKQKFFGVPLDDWKDSIVVLPLERRVRRDGLASMIPGKRRKSASSVTVITGMVG